MWKIRARHSTMPEMRWISFDGSLKCDLVTPLLIFVSLVPAAVPDARRLVTSFNGYYAVMKNVRAIKIMQSFIGLVLTWKYVAFLCRQRICRETPSEWRRTVRQTDGVDASCRWFVNEQRTSAVYFFPRLVPLLPYSLDYNTAAVELNLVKHAAKSKERNVSRNAWPERITVRQVTSGSANWSVRTISQWKNCWLSSSIQRACSNFVAYWHTDHSVLPPAVSLHVWAHPLQLTFVQNCNHINHLEQTLSFTA